MNIKPHYTVLIENDIVRFVFTGTLSFDTLAQWRTIDISTDIDATNRHVVLDVTACTLVDSACLMLLSDLQQRLLVGNVETVEFRVPDHVQHMVAVLRESKQNRPNRNTQSALAKSIESIGLRTQNIIADTRQFIEFIGDITLSAGKLLVRPHLMRWKDFPLYFAQAGVFAVPIILIVGALIGVIIGYQGAMQLKMFGADRFLADLVGISVTRELGPLIAAILISGRSGAAFAAEIGTMKVGEEVASLRSLGIDTTLFLIWPRMIAVMLAAPLLTMLCIVAAIAGGMGAGLATLDITVAGFVTSLHEALPVKHLLVGLGKSIVFGMLIAVVGAFRGMQVRGGAEAVGRFTTSAVVTCILFVILLDAVFAIILQTLGI